MQIGKLVQEGAITIKTGPFGTQLKAAEYQETGIPVLNVKNLGYGTVNSAKLDHVGADTVERLRVHLLQQGDIVFGRKGAVDRHAYIDNESDGWMQGSDCIRLRVETDDINPRFLSYYFLTNQHKAFMISMCSHGTTMASLNQKILEQIDFPCLERNYQDKIVEILSKIDEKGRVNQKINENLQEQAQAIYHHMIIENADAAWTPGVLSDIAVITMGQSPKGESYNEDGVGTYTTDPKRMAQANDVLMSVRAPVGDMNVAYEDCCIGRGLGAIRSKDGHQSFVLYTMFALREQLNVFNGEGTVFGSINRDALNSMPVDIPPKEIMDQFEDIVAPMDAAIRNNYDEICRLQAMRDSLLPRLMSGELDVSDIDL